MKMKVNVCCNTEENRNRKGFNLQIKNYENGWRTTNYACVLQNAAESKNEAWTDETAKGKD